MKLLALDASTEYCTLALYLEGEIMTREIHAGQKHSELILPMLRELLDEVALDLTALEGIAFGEGPGSFTGLRIGCGVAQGLAFGADLPVVGISTLQALAQGTGASRVIACLDARMGEIYHAAYEKGGQGWHVLHAPSLCLAQDAPLLEGDDWAGCGSGFAQYGEALARRYAGCLNGVDAAAFPHARDIAALAAPLFEQGLGAAPATAAPLYIRNKVALKASER